MTSHRLVENTEMHIFDKRLELRVYKEFLQVKRQTIQYKNEGNTWRNAPVKSLEGKLCIQTGVGIWSQVNLNESHSDKPLSLSEQLKLKRTIEKLMKMMSKSNT